MQCSCEDLKDSFCCKGQIESYKVQKKKKKWQTESYNIFRGTIRLIRFVMGMGEKNIMSLCHTFVHETTVNKSMAAYIRTHLQQQSMAASINHLFPGWSFESNHSPEAENGRIIVVWDPLFWRLLRSLSRESSILQRISPSSMLETLERRELPCGSCLKDLAVSSPISSSPWLVMGDFNQILSISEAYSLLPTSISLAGMEDLQECLDACRLFWFVFKGLFLYLG